MLVTISVAVLFAELIGTLYFQLNHSQASIRNCMGVLFFIMMNTAFSSLGSLEMFLVDRAIYVREHNNGMYSALTYYIGKIIQDVPVSLVVNLIFNLIVYLLVGLQLNVWKFLVFECLCAVVMLNSYAMCLFMSNLAKKDAVANISASLALVLYLLPRGGMLISLNSIPFIWRWIKYIFFVRYGFAALVINEFDGLTLVCDQAENVVPCITFGTAYAVMQGFNPEDLSRYVWTAFGSVFVYLLMGYVLLRIWRSSEGKWKKSENLRRQYIHA